MKDWPRNLRINAAACVLAEHMFHARGDVYGGETNLRSQPPHIRDRYIGVAADFLKAQSPPGKQHDSLFRFAARLARDQFTTEKP